MDISKKVTITKTGHKHDIRNNGKQQSGTSKRGDINNEDTDDNETNASNNTNDCNTPNVVMYTYAGKTSPTIHTHINNKDKSM